LLGRVGYNSDISALARLPGIQPAIWAERGAEAEWFFAE
jgi:hypothetical protein